MSISDFLKQKLSKESLTDTSGTKKYTKGILAVVIVIILGALGLETNNKDFDVQKLIETKSFSASQILRDKDGNLLPATKDACLSNVYNCSDFSSQEEAQAIFDQCKALGSDKSRLDGNKDGVACQSLKKSDKQIESKEVKQEINSEVKKVEEKKQ